MYLIQDFPLEKCESFGTTATEHSRRLITAVSLHCQLPLLNSRFSFVRVLHKLVQQNGSRGFPQSFASFASRTWRGLQPSARARCRQCRKKISRRKSRRTHTTKYAHDRRYQETIQGEHAWRDIENKGGDESHIGEIKGNEKHKAGLDVNGGNKGNEGNEGQSYEDNEVHDKGQEGESKESKEVIKTQRWARARAQKSWRLTTMKPWNHENVLLSVSH